MALFMDGRPTFYQRCAICRKRFRYGLRPPTWWRRPGIEGSQRIGPPGVPICCGRVVPLTMSERNATTTNREYARWLHQAVHLSSALGAVERMPPKFYRPPGGE